MRIARVLMAVGLAASVALTGCRVEPDPAVVADGGTEEDAGPGPIEYGDVCEGGRSVSTDLEARNVAACGRYQGDLTVRGGDLTTLLGLRGLTAVEGSLTLTELEQLTDLEGLEDLTAIEGDLRVLFNENLTSLDGLGVITTFSRQADDGMGNMVTFGGALHIEGNKALTEVSAAANLPALRSLHVGDNEALASLAGLGGFTQIPGRLTLRANPALESLDDLSMTTSVGGLRIESMAGLTTLGGLSALSTVDGDLQIVANTQLTSLELTALQSVSGTVVIRGNTEFPGCLAEDLVANLGSDHAETAVIQDNAPLGSCQDCFGNFSLPDDAEALQDCTGVSGDLIIEGPGVTSLIGLLGLTEVGGDLRIRDATSLTSLGGLSDITTVGGTVEVTRIPGISSLAGLVRLQSTGGDVDIVDNDGLSTLTGLGSLVTIGGDLAVKGNGSLTTLAALDDLTTISGDLDVLSNPFLVDLGLEELAFVGGRLDISQNVRLAQCVAQEFADALFANGQLSEPPQVVANDTSASCLVCEGTYSISEPEDLTFVEGCTDITGSLVLDEVDALSLTQLDELRTVMGDVLVLNTLLTDLDALGELREVGGSLHILGNDDLTSITGLGQVGQVGSELIISGNRLLTAVDAFVPLVEVPGHLEITGNGDLTGVGGLSFLGRVGGHMRIANNEQLTSLDPLVRLVEVGDYLIIQNNQGLTSLAGLDAIAAVGHDLEVKYNDSLTELGFAQLGAVGNNLTVQGNPVLPTCQADALKTRLGDMVQSVEISNNDDAASCP